MNRFNPTSHMEDSKPATPSGEAATPTSELVETTKSESSAAAKQPETENPAVAQNAPQARVYRRRRTLAVSGVLMGALVFGWMAIPRNGSTPDMLSVDQANAAVYGEDIPLADQAAQDQANAIRLYKAAGSFKGFKPQPGGVTQFTYRGATALFSRSLDGQCVFYAVVDGTATTVQTDQTGAACKPDAMRKARAQLGKPS